VSSIPSCPGPERLRRLLDAILPEDEQAPLLEHLEGCARCREALEALAAGRDSWAEVARHLRGETGPEPTRSAPSQDRGTSLDFLDPPAKPGQLGKLAHYEILEVIGRGGMGVVLKAFDQTLHRVVAVKVMAPELAVSGTARERFEREAQAAAAVSHDHVVTIHAVAEAKGLPYLVMQYVPGESLQQKLDREGPLPLKEILRIGMQTAQGLAAAHAQGLIHRDVKPANILLENGVQRVKITDFGLARAVDDASLTQSGVIAGTPQYMSPEQALGEPQDYRTDLFSLGSVLYALCTGRPPFRAPNALAVLRRVADDTPRPIRETNPEVPDWLEAIIQKLMEKHPVDRFQSAAEVARLLESHLANLQQPAGIPRPTPVPAVKQPAKRTHVAFWMLMAAGAMCLACCVLPTALTGLFFALELRPPPSAADSATIEDSPAVLRPGPPEPPFHLDPFPPKKNAGPKTTFDAGKRDLLCVALSKDEKTLAAGFEDGSVLVWDVATRNATTLAGHKLPVRSLAFTPHGKMLLTGAGELPRPKAAGEVKLWDLATRKAEGNYDVGDIGPVWAVAVSPDGRTIVAGGEAGIKPWEVRTGAVWRAQPTVNGVRSLAFAPNGQNVAVAGDRAVVNVYTDDWHLRCHRTPYKHRMEAICYSPDGETLAAGYADGTVKLWGSRPADVWDPQPLASVRVSEKSVRSLAYCRYAGKDAGARWVLAVGLSDQTVKLIDAADPGKPIDFPRAGEQVGGQLAVSPDGTCLATAHRNGVIRLWDLSVGKPAVLSAREEAAEKDIERLQGLWGRVAIASGGSHYGEDPDDTFMFVGNRFGVYEKHEQLVDGRMQKVTLAGTFEIVDALAEPKQMDLICTEGRHKGKHLRAIYKIEGDRLETCTDDGSGHRPRKFSGAEGFYRIMKRKNP
jgi:serine/threonine-protein kinase